ncbi:plasmid stabilization system family protein, partial [Vibrio parahaemolyticus EKP-008]
SKICRKP